MSDLVSAINVSTGYIDLGMFQEAWDELESLPPELRGTDAILELRIQIYQQLGKWKSARVLAESVAKRSPENPAWWMQWAFSARREQASTDEARMILEHAAVYHPECAPILYNLACYSCVAGDVAPARALLKRAFSIDADFREVALDDPDLAAIFGAGPTEADHDR